MMRQNETRRRAPMLLVLDVRPGAYTQATFERAVEAFASIATALDNKGRPFEVVWSTGTLVGVPGRRHLATIMDELAIVQPHGADRMGILSTRRRSSAVIAVTGRLQTHDSGALGVMVRDGGTLLAVVTNPTDSAVAPRSRRFRLHVVVDAGDRPFCTSGTRRCCGGSAAAVTIRRSQPRGPDARRGTRARPGVRERRMARCDARRVARTGARLRDRRRSPLASLGRATLAAVLGVGLAIVVDAPADTLAGIPTPGALSAFAGDLGKAPAVLRSATVPVAPVGAALLLAFVAVYRRGNRNRDHRPAARRAARRDRPERGAVRLDRRARLGTLGTDHSVLRPRDRHVSRVAATRGSHGAAHMVPCAERAPLANRCRRTRNRRVDRRVLDHLRSGVPRRSRLGADQLPQARRRQGIERAPHVVAALEHQGQARSPDQHRDVHGEDV